MTKNQNDELNVISRKARRKEERKSKKRGRSDINDIVDDKQNNNDKTQNQPDTKKVQQQQNNKEIQSRKIIHVTQRKQQKTNSTTKNNKTNDRRLLDSTIAAAIAKDDEEIDDLERKLYGTNSKDKKNWKRRLNKEYAKMEGFGDDFGDFLDDVDEIVNRVGTHTGDNKNKTLIKDSNDDNDYDFDDDDDDDGDDVNDVSKSSDSSDSEELLPMKRSSPDLESTDTDDDEVEIWDDDEENALSGFNDNDSADSDELDDDEILDDDDDDEEEEEEEDSNDDDDDDDEGEGEEKDDDEDDGNDDEGKAEDNNNTYRPAKGEDIYGKIVELDTKKSEEIKAYTAPHLRNKGTTTTQSTIIGGGGVHNNNNNNEEILTNIRKSINGSLNRLSENSIIPISQSISKLYTNYAKSDVNVCLWEITKKACVIRTQQMMTLIPVYVCALAGIHYQKNDTVHLGDYLMEKSVVDLFHELDKARQQQQQQTISSDDDNNGTNDDDDTSPHESKEASNLMLIVCYLYNYGIVHCRLLYDIVKNLIESFTEIDMELLSLIIKHCGRALRSDDPTALKEIILLVQKKSLLINTNNNRSSSSRFDFMITAMTNLKNNKRNKNDEGLIDKMNHLRKVLGHIKSNHNNITNTTGKSSSSSSETATKVTLVDIMNVESKGRWWLIGASWTGSQDHSVHNNNNHGDDAKKQDHGAVTHNDDNNGEEDNNEELFQLASKLRMNTDLRRTIFYIIIKSTDYEDCFEKLIRVNGLKNRNDRDVVRVLMECCCNEKSYNPFYSHLSSRICDYQPQCKFTFELAYWDILKQLDTLTTRKVANLAKLLYNLVSIHHCVKMNVLKPFIDDMASPESLSENSIIFLTLFFTSIIDHCTDEIAIQLLFQFGQQQQKGNKKHKKNMKDDWNDDFDNDDGNNDTDGDDVDDDHQNDTHALRASITVFLLQVMKSSPKYKKGSKFRTNLKAAITCCDPDVLV